MNTSRPISAQKSYVLALHFDMVPRELQKVLDELEASRLHGNGHWENLQELRWVLQDAAGKKLPPPATRDVSGELWWTAVGKNITPTRGLECSANPTTPEPETSFFASDRYEQSIRAIKGLKDAFLGVDDKL